MPAIARGSALGAVPLRAYLRLNLGVHRPPTEAAFLPAQTRQALTSLLEPLASWQDAPAIGGRIYELEEFGLPGNPDQLALWLKTTGS